MTVNDDGVDDDDGVEDYSVDDCVNDGVDV